MRRVAVLILSACAALPAGCTEDLETVTGPTVVTVYTQLFQGSLAVGGTRFYSFTVNEAGAASVTLASVASPATGAALPVALGLGIGIPAGTGCALAQSATSGPALTAQLLRTVTPGIYCVSVYDVGNLTVDVTFAIRFSHP